MRLSRITSGLALLAAPMFLSACAGTPPQATAEAGPHKCTHVTGSLLCAEDEAPPANALNSPTFGQAQIYVGPGPHGK